MRIAIGLILFSALGIVAVLGLGAALTAGDDGPEQGAPARVSVDALVDASPRWYRKPIVTTGRATPIDDEGFVLQDGDDAIVVQPQPSTVDGTIEEGERVTVTGMLTGYGRPQVQELRRLRDSGRYPALADAPTELEDYFITADDVDARN